MTPAEVVALIGFLDELFSLGGQLVQAALDKKPELKLDRIPDLTEMEQSRKDALNRVHSEKDK